MFSVNRFITVGAILVSGLVSLSFAGSGCPASQQKSCCVTKSEKCVDKCVISKNEKGEATCSYYTCTMHPEIMQATAGKCPTCSMDLIQKTELKADCKMKCKSGAVKKGKCPMDSTKATVN